MNKTPQRVILVNALLTLFWAGVAQAAVSLEVLGPGAAFDISADGTVVAGNTAFDFDPFRWTRATGIVPLGRIGQSGTPDISIDGTRITATVLSADSTAWTPAVWTEGVGWTELLPPGPPDLGFIDMSYGTAWGLSGDGNSVVGLYWRNTNVGGLAHAFRWQPSTGVVDLGSSGQDSRANDASMDGSVVVGWAARTDGVWQPTVWQNGTMTQLSATDGNALAAGVNEAGDIIVGSSYDNVAATPQGAIWRWNGSSWVEQQVGNLFGTHPVFGSTELIDLTEDGSVIVGLNQFNPGNVVAAIWTPADGLQDGEQWLLANGVSVPPDLRIASFTGISFDGSTICGVAQEIVPPYGTRAILVHTDFATDAPPAVGEMKLQANYPNPFNPRTTIPVDVSIAGRARLEVLDLRGRLVRVLHDGNLEAGRSSFVWSGVDDDDHPVASGVYRVRLRDATGAVSERRIALVK